MKAMIPISMMEHKYINILDLAIVILIK